MTQSRGANFSRSSLAIVPLPLLLSVLVFLQSQTQLHKTMSSEDFGNGKTLCKYKEAGVTFCKRGVIVCRNDVCWGKIPK